MARIKINDKLQLANTGKPLDKINVINSNHVRSGLTPVDPVTAASYLLLDYEVPEDGTYLIVGVAHVNHYGQGSRNLSTCVAKNWANISSTIGVCNTYVWTLSQSICCICDFIKGNHLEIYVTNSDTSKTWACGGGNVDIIRLNDFR